MNPTLFTLHYYLISLTYAISNSKHATSHNFERICRIASGRVDHDSIRDGNGKRSKTCVSTRDPQILICFYIFRLKLIFFFFVVAIVVVLLHVAFSLSSNLSFLVKLNDSQKLTSFFSDAFVRVFN